MAARALLHVALAFGVALVVGCNRPRWDTPIDAYKSFARALEKGERNTAWNALSSESRKIVEARSKAVSQASGGAIQDDPQLLVFGGNFTASPIDEVKVVKQEGDVATLSVSPRGGQAREVRMVKEGEAWKLDVSELLKE